MALPVALTAVINTQTVVKASLYDAYGSIVSTGITWSSSDTTIATVQPTIDLKNGALIFTYGNTGSCTITAAADSSTATFNLTVIAGTVGATTDIELSADDSLQPKKKMQA
jgi:hypothetical protein